MRADYGDIVTLMAGSELGIINEDIKLAPGWDRKIAVLGEFPFADWA